MKKKVVMLLAFLSALYCFYGCGTDRWESNYIENITPSDPSEDTQLVDLSGYYVMPYGGYFEIIKLNDGRYLVYQQQVFSENYGDTLAYHPNMFTGPHVLQSNNTIVYAQNLTYSATTHGLKVDGSLIDITGSRRTEYILKINEETGIFEYKAVVRADTTLIGAIQVNRTIIEE